MLLTIEEFLHLEPILNELFTKKKKRNWRTKVYAVWFWELGRIWLILGLNYKLLNYKSLQIALFYLMCFRGVNNASLFRSHVIAEC